MRECKICSSLFIPNSHNQIYCSVVCKTFIRKEQKQTYDKIYGKKYYLKYKKEMELDRQVNKLKKQQYDANYKQKNKDSRNKKEKHLRMVDMEYKLLGNLRNRLRQALKNNSKSNSTTKLLGCSVAYLKYWLELQFTAGMSWENWGQFGWHIDHIRPCVNFDLAVSEQQQECFHYTNLQPLWWYENLRKRFIKNDK